MGLNCEETKQGGENDGVGGIGRGVRAFTGLLKMRRLSFPRSCSSERNKFSLILPIVGEHASVANELHSIPMVLLHSVC